LHFIHHFAVKSAVADCASMLTNSQFEYPGSAIMTKFSRRCGREKIRIALVLCLLGSAIAVPNPALAADTLTVTVDQATVMKLPERVATIVVGNPLIADVAVQSGGLVVVTGKGYGSTNLIVLDRAGAVLTERSIIVRGATDRSVQVYRGVERETYSCTPDCERRITLGDSATYFQATIDQAENRSGRAKAK
jgi:Flp pilus assembly secretin CpaC